MSQEVDSSLLSKIREQLQRGNLEAVQSLLAEPSSLPHDVKLIESVLAGALKDAPPRDLIDQLSGIYDLQSVPADSIARFHLARGILFNRSSEGFEKVIYELKRARNLYLECIGFLHQSEVLIEQGKVFAWSGQELRSLRCYTQALAELVQRPNPALEFQCHWCLGKLNLEMGRWSHAVEYFDHAQSVLPPASSVHNSKYFIDYAQALLGTEDYDFCQEILLKLSDADLRNLSFPYRTLVFYKTLTLSYIRNGNQPKAIETQGIMGELFADAKLGFYEKNELKRVNAEFEQQFGDPTKAIKYFESILPVYSEKSYVQPCLEILSQIAQTQVKQGDSEKASITLNDAINYAREQGANSSISALRTLREHLDLPEVASEESNRAVGYKLQGQPSAYVLLDRLGSGSYGSVYRAQDLENDREVALKRVDLSTYNGRLRQALKESLRTELQSCASLKHQGIARVLSWGEDSDQLHYITQEYVRGPTLRSYLESNQFSISNSIRLMRDIFLSLDEIHRAGLVHCDLKPENIILRDKNSPVLVDFGVACLASRRNGERNSGTLKYMPPEALLNFKQVPSNDIFSAGIIFLEILGGNIPELKNQQIRSVVNRHRHIRYALKAVSTQSEIIEMEPLANILSDILNLQINGRPKDAFKVAGWLNNILSRIDV